MSGREPLDQRQPAQPAALTGRRARAVASRWFGCDSSSPTISRFGAVTTGAGLRTDGLRPHGLGQVHRAWGGVRRLLTPKIDPPTDGR